MKVFKLVRHYEGTSTVISLHFTKAGALKMGYDMCLTEERHVETALIDFSPSDVDRGWVTVLRKEFDMMLVDVVQYEVWRHTLIP